MGHWRFAALAWSLGLLATLIAGEARAWVSLAVRGDEVTLDLQPDGSALVEHQILLSVRGGPLKEFSFTGVDEDAEPAGEPTAVRARSGSAAGYPIPLIWEREGGHLHFELASKRGLGSGSYLIQFSYTTDLGAAGKIQRASDSVRVSWDGLLLSDGIDSATTRFVVPHGVQSPRLPHAATDATEALVADEQGVFLSTLLREADRDVLTVTRPHVAAQERVRWTILVDPGLLSPGAASPPAAGRAEANDDAVFRAPKARSVGPELILAACVGLLLCALIALKRALLRRSFSKHGGGVRFLIPLANSVRFGALFASASAAAYLALVPQQATLAATLWTVAIALSVQLPHPPPEAARGPGRWKVLDKDALWASPSAHTGAARWLDAGSVPGFLLFLVVAGAATVAGLRLLGTAPYYSASVFAASSGLIPVFFTLGSSELAQPLTYLQRRLLVAAAIRLEKRGISFDVVGRFAANSEGDEPDEYRLLLGVQRPLAGLRSLEVAVEFGQGLLLVVSSPVLLIKVLDQSPAYAALPRSADWSRGSSRHERVALLRPRVPNLQLLVDCCAQLRSDLSAPPGKPRPGAAAGQRRGKPTSARGSAAA